MPSSAENNKRIAKNTILLYFRMLLIMCVTLYTSRVVLDKLGELDYGIYNVVAGVIVALAFINGAMSQSTQRFLAVEIGLNDLSKARKVFTSAIIIHGLIAIGVLIIGETIGLWLINSVLEYPVDKKFQVNVIYQLSIFTFIVSVMQVPFNAEIIAHEKMKFFAYLSMLEAALKLGIALSLTLISGEKLIYYGLMIFVSSLLCSAVYIFYCLKSFSETCLDRNINRDLIRQMGSFSGWNSMGFLVAAFKNQGLNIILNIFFGPIVNAAFGICNQVNSAVNSFNQNFMTAMNPQIFKTYAQNKIEDFSNLVYRGSKFSFLLIAILSFPVFLNTGFVLNLWLKEVPEYTVTFVQLILVNTILESFTYSIGTAIQAKGDIKWYQIFVSGINLLMLPIAFLFFRLGFGPTYGLIVLACISLISLIVRLYFLNSILRINLNVYFMKVLLPSLVISLIIIAVIKVLNYFSSDSIFQYFLELLIGWAILLFSVWIIGLSKGEKQYILNFVNTKFLHR